MVMLPGPLPHTGKWVWLHGTPWGVNSGVAVCQVPGKEGAWLVLRVVLVAASGLNWRGDHGCSGETGAVVVNLGAVDVKQMLCVEQRRLRRFFLFLILSACRFLALSKLPSSQCIPIPLLVALIKVCFPSKFGSWDKRTERGEGRGGECIEGTQPS